MENLRPELNAEFTHDQGTREGHRPKRYYTVIGRDVHKHMYSMR